MKKYITLLLLLVSSVGFSKKQDTRYFEMRIYYCHPGRLDALLQRFRNHTTKIFEKHGMTNIGYWIPNKNDENALYYILSYPSQVARDSSWKQFGRDPEWKEVAKKSEESGKIVAKVTSIFMNATDFSPKIKKNIKSPDRTFEMRTYTASPEKIENVLARFRNHTTKLFEKHGMTNIAYFRTIEKEGQSKLFYILAHQSEDAGKASFDAFRKDPDWIKVKEESEKNGKIVDKVESIYMSPTDFSLIK
ncbi:MAG: hypothetical protein RJA76_1838 [Bacteroidota bacterium]|jgi:heme-degrading monooxygenase HmoA